MTPGDVEQGVTPAWTFGLVSDEIDRPSCDRRQEWLCYQTPPSDGPDAVVHVDVTDVTR